MTTSGPTTRSTRTSSVPSATAAGGTTNPDDRGGSPASFVGGCSSSPRELIDTTRSTSRSHRKVASSSYVAPGSRPGNSASIASGSQPVKRRLSLGSVAASTSDVSIRRLVLVRMCGAWSSRPHCSSATRNLGRRPRWFRHSDRPQGRAGGQRPASVSQAAIPGLDTMPSTTRRWAASYDAIGGLGSPTSQPRVWSVTLSPDEPVALVEDRRELPDRGLQGERLGPRPFVADGRRQGLQQARGEVGHRRDHAVGARPERDRREVLATLHDAEVVRPQGEEAIEGDPVARGVLDPDDVRMGRQDAGRSTAPGRHGCSAGCCRGRPGPLPLGDGLEVLDDARLRRTG